MNGRSALEKKQDALWRQQGRMMMRGALDEVWRLFLFLIFIIVINFALTPPDDCDASFWHRCGMRILTDHKTGIQYLETRGGGLIERKTGALSRRCTGRSLVKGCAL